LQFLCINWLELGLADCFPSLLLENGQNVAGARG